MFERVELNLASQWHTPTIGELAELLVFYDRVDIRAPLGRLSTLFPYSLADMSFFRQLVEDHRITITIDQLPLGEVAWELGLFPNGLGMRADGAHARERMREAYPSVRPTPLQVLASEDETYSKAWEVEWQHVMAQATDPFQTQKDYLDAVIRNAEEKMRLITQPDFLSTALADYGATANPTIRQFLLKVAPIPVEVEGRSFMGLDATGLRTAAELFEFLSQADVLLDTVNGGDDHDTFTSPDFDRWSQKLIAGSLSRAGIREDLAAFQTSVLGKSTIAAAIDGGAKTFRQIEPLLEAREPFAKMVRDRPVDASLADAYFKEVHEVSWFTHGAGKAVRFSVFTGAGVAAAVLLAPFAVAAIAAGAGLGALDYFVIDKVIRGAACRTFVEDKLKPFVAGNALR